MKPIYSLLSTFLIPVSVLSQSILLRGGDEKNTLDTMLQQLYKPPEYEFRNVPTIKLAKRKHDSFLFCNEFIPYKKGHIINSLSASPGGRGKIDLSYRFFYLYENMEKLIEIKTEILDTIHSIIPVENTLFLSGIKNNKTTIVKIENGNNTTLSTAGLMTSMNNNKWVKLAFYQNKLFALTPNNVYTYNINNNNWEILLSYSLDSYYFSLGYKKSQAVIPTENIKINNNTAYFLQEVTQQRDSYLMALDLCKDSSLTEFWSKRGLTDNTEKEIMDYDFRGNSLVVVAYRLMENSILFTETNNDLKILLLNNRIGKYSPEKISSTKFLDDGSILLAGETGCYLFKDNKLTAQFYIENVNQEIKDDGETYHYDFVPRCIEKMASGNYLLGGLWGGIYLFEVNSKKVKCLDDLKKRPAEEDIFKNK